MSHVATFLRDHLAATRDFMGCTGTPTPPAFPAGYAQAIGLFLWDMRYHTPVQAYNKSWYLAIHSGSTPDTSGQLSRACTGPILNMVHQTLSVFE